MVATPATTDASGRNLEALRYLRSAIVHYEWLNYEKALEQIEKSRAKATTARDESSAAILAGVVLADSGRVKKAERAFTDGFSIDLDAPLPVTVSPKIAMLAEKARRRVRALLAQHQAAQPSLSFSVCAEADAAAGRLWNAANKATIFEKLSKSSVPEVAAVAQGLVDRLEAWVHGWSDQQLATCIRGEVHHTLSQLEIAQRQRCLARAADSFSALLDSLSGHLELQAPPRELTALVQDPVDCIQPPPETPEQASVAAETRKTLGQAAAQLELGQLEAAQKYHELAVNSAAPLKNVALDAEIKRLAGQILLRRGNTSGAVAALEESAAAAVEARALRLAVDVLTQLIEVRGGFQRNFAAAQKDMAWAQRLIPLAPESARLQIGLLLAWSRILLESGSFAEARATLEKALRQQRKLEPSVLSSRLLASIYFRLGGAYYGLGNVSPTNPTVLYTKATEYSEKSVNLVSEVLGPNAPELVSARSNLAAMFLQFSDDLEKVEAILKQAIAVAEALHWPRGKGGAHANLGQVYLMTDRLPLAQEYLEAALDWDVKTLGPEHRDLTLTLELLGRVQREMGFPEKAVVYHRRLERIAEQLESEGHAEAPALLAGARLQLGLDYASLEDWPKAAPLAAGCVQAIESDYFDVDQALFCQVLAGQVAWAQGARTKAVRDMQRIVKSKENGLHGLVAINCNRARSIARAWLASHEVLLK